jgi:hypothetical protein
MSGHFERHSNLDIDNNSSIDHRSTSFLRHKDDSPGKESHIRIMNAIQERPLAWISPNNA